MISHLPAGYFNNVMLLKAPVEPECVIEVLSQLCSFSVKDGDWYAAALLVTSDFSLQSQSDVKTFQS